MSASESLLFEAFSETVLEINRVASSVPMAGFQEAALDVLARQIDFDSAWWGVGSNVADGAANVHASVAYRLPDSYVAAWTEIKADDVLEQAITRETGRAFD